MDSGNFEGGGTPTSTPASTAAPAPGAESAPVASAAPTTPAISLSSESSIKTKEPKTWTVQDLEIDSKKNVKVVADNAVLQKLDEKGSLIHTDLSGMTDEQRQRIEQLGTFSEFGGETAYGEFVKWAVSKGFYEDRKSEGGGSLGIFPKEGTNVQEKFQEFLTSKGGGGGVETSDKKADLGEVTRIFHPPEEKLDQHVTDRDVEGFVQEYKDTVAEHMKKAGLSEEETQEALASNEAFIKKLREAAFADVKAEATGENPETQEKQSLFTFLRKKLNETGTRTHQLEEKLDSLHLMLAEKYGNAAASLVVDNLRIDEFIQFICTGQFFERVAKELQAEYVTMDRILDEHDLTKDKEAGDAEHVTDYPLFAHEAGRGVGYSWQKEDFCEAENLKLFHLLKDD